FLDFRRAFEIIDREILWVKMKKIGVDAVVLRWFESYLTNRYQAVKFGNCISSKKEIKYGVPQGTVLGPILFLLYLNDIVGSVEHCGIHLFADDTMICITGTDINAMVNKINSDLD